ncbi:hypothetical protein EMCG_09658 [[Emmonsia] crescens]|uniref:Uncharacterized protein n=1 Tax=[Emmonsia] crescens TaxID=73230 RepID=A0A0G2I189_9EURO|nr:hypothetical protein EMCG_09658 [Emmonsia crescens UAMH 3008]
MITQETLLAPHLARHLVHKIIPLQRGLELQDRLYLRRRGSLRRDRQSLRRRMLRSLRTFNWAIAWGRALSDPCIGR